MGNVMRTIARAPALVKAGVVCGIMAGAAGATLVAPIGVGMVLGVLAGAAVGFGAGLAMHREHGRRAGRDRELDEIIGVTSGSLGVPRESLHSLPPEEEDAKEAWVKEWLTPPPPAAVG